MKTCFAASNFSGISERATRESQTGGALGFAITSEALASLVQDIYIKNSGIDDEKHRISGSTIYIFALIRPRSNQTLIGKQGACNCHPRRS